MRLISSVYGSGKSAYERAKRASNLNDKYDLKDRRKNSDVLVIVLAGYKQPLWPYVFPRFAKSVPAGADVCIMSAGKFDEALDKLSADHGWSYLATKTNDVSLVQNVAISLFPAAKTIIKVDEDVFLTETTLTSTLAYHFEVKAQGIANPAFTAPMLNVNGVCYRPLLKQIGQLEAYESKFGTARYSTLGVKATDDAEAARWLWEVTAPLEETEKKLRRTTEPELMAPVQFSIGVVVFDRAFWEEIGYFPVKRHQLMMKKSTLGADEEYFCRMAMFHARPIVVCQHAIAGHFSFGRQYAGMLELLKERPELFA